MSWDVLKADVLAAAAAKMWSAPVYVSMENERKEEELVPVYGFELRADGKAVITMP